MIKDITPASTEQILEKDGLQLPSFSDVGLDSLMSQGKSLKIDGTNVVRVPFGVRQARKQRPTRPQTWATLVLPFQPAGSPTPPPPQAA